MRIKYFLLACLVSACSHTSAVIDKAQEDKIKTDMAAFNTRLLGQLYRSEMKGDLSKLESAKYLVLVREKHEPSEEDYAKLVSDKDVEVRVRAERENFFVCVKAGKARLVICDDAGSTEFSVDYVSREMNQNLSELIRKPRFGKVLD